MLLLKKNSLITSPRLSFKAALHFFFPTSIPRLFTFKPSLYFFVLACRRHTSIHLLTGIMTAARIWPSQDFTLYLLEYTSFGPNQRTVLIQTRRFSCRQDWMGEMSLCMISIQLTKIQFLAITDQS